MSCRFARRALFRRLVPEAVEHASVAVRKSAGLDLPPRRRPPGAIAEAQFLDKCTRCNACADACPERAVYKLADHVAIGAGTPVMVPDERPCRFCEGFPCAAACETGALVVPSSPSDVRLGTVTLDASRCLPFMGPECGACGGLCPTDPPALRLRLGRPDVDEAACVGCGMCIEACPVEPPALALLPLGA